MPLWKNTQHSFAAGQLDTHVMGRQDMDMYFRGATLLKNFIVKRQGCISKRRGTDLAADLGGLLGTRADGTPITPKKMRLVPVTNGDDGRYLVLSGGMAYVASRDGVLTADGRHVRRVDAYVAEDEDGNATATSGRDDRRSTSTPFDVIHGLGPGNYRVTRHAGLQEALDAAEDGDTVRFHNDYMLEADAILRSERFTPSDGVASTFALDGATWKMTRGSSAYTATVNGRYVARPMFDVGTMTATRTWTFSTSHANRSFTPGWNYPGWKLTAVDSAEAAGTADDLTVAFSVDGAGLTATRADTASAWAFSDGLDWTMAFSGDKWTASRTIGSANSSDRDIATPGFTVALGGESVTATSTWSFSDGGDWGVTYSSPTFRFSNPDYATMALNGSYDTTSFSVPRRVVARRAPKQVVVDLYGYKLTVMLRCSLQIATPRTGIRFATGRRGARVWCVSNSNCSILRTLPGLPKPASDDDRPGDVAFGPGIEWRMNGGASNQMISLSHCRSVTFSGGTFVDASENGEGVQADMITLSGVASATFDGGAFDAGPAAGSLSLVRLLGGTQATVNAGEFVSRRPGSCSYVFAGMTEGSRVAVRGGRFSYASREKFAERGTWAKGSPFYDSAFVGIWRGEFSFDEFWDLGAGAWKGVGEFPPGTTVPNETNPSADGYYGFRQPGEGDYSHTGRGVYADPYRIRVPYADDDLADLCIRQSGDTLFVAHRSYPPAKISFDAWGYADFDELEFDNTSVNPPVIVSASMAGQNPVEADWPAEFPALVSATQSGGTWDVSGVPPWLSRNQTQAQWGYHVKVDGELRDDWSLGFESGQTTLRDDKGAVKARVPYEFGKDAVEFTWTEWPDGGGKGVVHQAVAGWFFKSASPSQVDSLKEFVLSCKMEGTVTNAGFSGNGAEGTDGSCNYACTYTCTVEGRSRLTGRKTTRVFVISFTKSVAKETTTTYTDGQPTGTATKTVTTDGTARNDACASSVLVPRTVRYVATYVKDGRESRPSAPAEVEYDMPWPNSAVVNIDLSRGDNESEPEYYNVYKDNGNGWGLVGTTDVDRAAAGLRGNVNSYSLYIPDASKDAPAVVCAADYETARGWAAGSLFRKLTSRSRDAFTASTDGDVCLVCPHSRRGEGIVFDFEPTRGADFNRMEFMLDGRVHDRANKLSYLVYSQPEVTCTVEYYKADGTSALFPPLKATPDCDSTVTGPYSAVAGTPKYMVSLSRKAVALPSGDRLVLLSLGGADQTEVVNENLRRVSFDLKAAIRAAPDFAAVRKVTLTFAPVQGAALFGDVYSAERNYQGCIHAAHFYKGGDTADAGMFQDDYISPDMSVTPPADDADPHFSGPGEYPGAVGVYGQRLVFASSDSAPSTLWMSRVADLYNFTPHDSIREDDALELTLAATEFPRLNHLVAGRDLLLFGDGGEWLVSPVTGNALTYKTAQAKLQSMVGSDRALQPLQLADETLFAERGGTCLRSINYNYSSDSYQSNDLSVIAQSIFRANPIVSMAYKQHPDSIVACVLADGRVGTLVYMKEQEVAAWSVQELGGGWKAREIATPKCIMNGTTETMLLVEKEGAYQLWKVRDDIDEPVASKQVVLDGIHVEKSADAAGEGEVAVALGDGAYAVGFPVVSEFVSVRPEPRQGPTAQMEVKNATECEIRVVGASTFSVKPYAIDAGWREVALPVVRSGSAVALAEKDCRRLVTGTNNRDGRIHVRHAEPWPLTILSVSTTYQVEYENGEGKGEGQ